MILAYLWIGIDNPNLRHDKNLAYNFYGKYIFSFDGENTVTVKDNLDYISFE